MTLPEIYEMSSILTKKLKGIDAIPKSYQNRVNIYLWIIDQLDIKSQIRILHSLNREIVRRNRFHNKPTEEAKSAYKKLVYEE